MNKTNLKFFKQKKYIFVHFDTFLCVKNKETGDFVIAERVFLHVPRPRYFRDLKMLF